MCFFFCFFFFFAISRQGFPQHFLLKKELAASVHGFFMVGKSRNYNVVLVRCKY